MNNTCFPFNLWYSFIFIFCTCILLSDYSLPLCKYFFLRRWVTDCITYGFSADQVPLITHKLVYFLSDLTFLLGYKVWILSHTRIMIYLSFMFVWVNCLFDFEVLAYFIIFFLMSLSHAHERVYRVVSAQNSALTKASHESIQLVYGTSFIFPWKTIAYVFILF